MRRFPRITLDITLEKELSCGGCKAHVQPFTVVFVMHPSSGPLTANAFRCEKCIKKEIERRAGVLRDEYATKKVIAKG